MQFFIGIVPPVEYKRRIATFQRQWRNNSLPDVVEPHITIKAQGGLTSEMEWLEQVGKVCERTSPFLLELSEIKFFGDSVLFLSVKSKLIYEFHRKLVNAVLPDKDEIKQFMELEQYVPHLTLGQTHWGLSSDELKNMAKLADEMLRPFPVITVNFIRIYQEIEPKRYRKYLDIALKNTYENTMIIQKTESVNKTIGSNVNKKPFTSEFV